MTETVLVNRALPLFLTEYNKARVGWTVMAFAAVMYLVSNHFHFLVPFELPRSWVDLAVPFMPNTVWIYISEYIFFFVIYVASSDVVNLNKYVYSFFFLQIMSCLIFWVWPTTYPRALFPLPDDLNPVTHFAFSLLRQADTPANCCPSLHVSSVFLGSFIFIDEKRRLFPYFFVWATAIAVSTLTTKQHYLVDVVTGLLMALIFYTIFHRWVQYRKVA